MPEKWVNFKELRQRISIADVLASYHVSVKVKGDQAQGFCPLPTHPVHEGKKRSASFSVNLPRGCWQCFSCGKSGNAIDLACRMERMNPENPADVRKAALLLDERFPTANSSATESLETPKPLKPESTPPADKKIVVNAPLEFELKHLDYGHPYLPSRRFSAHTIKHFGLGFCSRGLMKDRVVIPLRDGAGQLVGYAGRVVDDALISNENPRYRFPSGREKGGVVYDFQKSRFLYNGFAVTQKDCEDVVVVESFTACWWLYQLGIENVVAVMGSSCSAEQAAEIVKIVPNTGTVWIVNDGDDAGEQCAVSIFKKVAPKLRVRWPQLHQGKQPTDYNQAALEEILR